MPTFFLQTFGCQQNHSDSERVNGVLTQAGFFESESMSDADLIIFNTCSIKQHAEDRVIGFIKKAHELRGEKPRKIGVTGCMIRQTSHRASFKQDPLLKKNPYLDFVFRIEDTPRLPAIIDGEKELAVSCIGENLEEFFALEPKLGSAFSAYVPIMTGCDKFCSYCIVPHTRGREKSRPLADIKADCEKLVARGVSEITLLGQNVNAFYCDDAERPKRRNQSDFAHLLSEIAKIKGLRRIRFTSPHPSQMSTDVLDVMSENSNICKHLHLPVQSGSDKILQAMNRSHTRADFQRITAYARKKMPAIAISTDIIVGFPGESEADIEATRQLCTEERFDMIYISKFSPRKGTVAYKMVDNVPHAEKKRRYQIVQDALEASFLARARECEGQTFAVLVEEIAPDGVATGKTEHNRYVHFPADGAKVGDYVDVRISRSGLWFLEGTRV